MSRLWNTEELRDTLPDTHRTEAVMTLKTKRVSSNGSSYAASGDSRKWRVTLDNIASEESVLQDRFSRRLIVNDQLDRTLVSFQANKAVNGHRWCKYKEGFSAELIRYILRTLDISTGRILDPFAGSGTTLFVAAECGLDGFGIELLPSSAEIIEARNGIGQCDQRQLARQLREFANQKSWTRKGEQYRFQVLRITDGAYPPESGRLLSRYLHDCGKVDDPVVSRLLRFAAMCVLESISYTRKDGQYLRWDYRSGRRQGAKRFDKGVIPGFTEAITAKLTQMADDLDPTDRLFAHPADTKRGTIELVRGSCLNVLPTVPAQSFSAVVTSPPYCNRYDYTRTYALELALLGIDESAIKALRQAMVSCTVENKAKEGLDSVFTRGRHSRAIQAFENQSLLQLVLQYLDQSRKAGDLNNTGIPRMVRNYFLEMSLVIGECARVLKRGAPMVMVNDNVRYHGAHLPVDLILSDIAEQLGFDVETIWVLPKGKGNSSQQMGAHGRKELRKCVYVWRRT